MLAACMLLLAALAQPYPEYTVAPDGSRIDLPGGTSLQVISDDTTVSGENVRLTYHVEGLLLEAADFSDTLLWLAPRPRSAISSAISTGRRRLYESRSLRLINLSGSHIGGEITVRSGRSLESASLFTAYRTWLMDGTPLELESVVQMDSRFASVIARLADLPGGSLDQGLISIGHWLDPQSFLIVRGEQGPLLRLGLPSWDEEGSMLVLDIPFDSLNTASGAMLD